MRQIAVLRAFAKVWLVLSIGLIAIGAFGIILTHGIDRFTEVFSPFNFINFAAMLLVISPAIIADRRATALQHRLPLTREEAERLVKEYGGILMRRSGFASLPIDALPAPKQRMKEAIKYAASQASDGPIIGHLGVGYVLLADFQRDGVSQQVQLLEMSGLNAEWQVFLTQRSSSRALGDVASPLIQDRQAAH